MKTVTGLRESNTVMPARGLEEKILLGKILLDDRHLLGMQEVAGKLCADMFYSPANAAVYRAMETIHGCREVVDVAKLLRELDKGGKPEGFAGDWTVYLPELSGIASEQAATEQIATYAELVLDAYMRRRALEETMRCATDLRDWNSSVDEVTSRTAAALTGILRDADSIYQNSARRIYDILREEWGEYGKRKGNGGNGAITTGLRDLDKVLTGGWKGGQMVVIGGRPGMGKTSLALHFALAAAEAGKSVLYFSLEMSSREMAIKILQGRIDFRIRHFLEGRLERSSEEKIADNIGKMGNLPLYISTRVDVSAAQIAAIAQSQQMQGSCDMVVVDYLQLIRIPRERGYNRENEVAALSRSLKVLALSEGIPVLVLCQLNRESEKREGKRPVLADLRESGAIEQDADTALLIYRPEHCNPTTQEWRGIGLIDVAKNRMGTTAEVRFAYSKKLTRIGDEDKLRELRQETNTDNELF
jgi:replicative DNA helicase